jgi:hypothetical protein
MLGLSIEEIQTTKDFDILGHIAEARRLMGTAMAPQVIEYAEDFLEGSEEKVNYFRVAHGRAGYSGRRA